MDSLVHAYQSARQYNADFDAARLLRCAMAAMLVDHSADSRKHKQAFFKLDRAAKYLSRRWRRRGFCTDGW